MPNMCGKLMHWVYGLFGRPHYNLTALPMLQRGRFGTIYALDDFSVLKHGFSLNDEIEALQACQGHRNIVTIHTVVELDKTACFTMQRADKDLFTAIVDNDPLDFSRIGLDVLNGLCHMHGLGYTHQDLKPENILLIKGSAVLCDFGHSGKQFRQYYKYGTKEYMTFDQLRLPSECPTEITAETPSVNCAEADMWAFTVVLFVLFMKCQPFSVDLIDGHSVRCPYAQYLVKHKRYNWTNFSPEHQSKRNFVDFSFTAKLNAQTTRTLFCVFFELA